MKKKKYTAFVTIVDGRRPTTEEYSGEAVNAQEFHKMIFVGEQLSGQWHNSPAKVIKFIENERGRRVFDDRKGFFGS